MSGFLFFFFLLLRLCVYSSSRMEVKTKTNIIFDFCNQVIIPQNDKENFIIEKNKYWNSGIVIKINFKNEIDYLNLYFILKSYLDWNLIPVYGAALAFLRTSINPRYVILENESSLFLRKMDYFYFCEWINFRILKENIYQADVECLGIFLMFNKSVYDSVSKRIGFDCLEFAKPVFPWTIEWLLRFKKELNRLDLQKKENEFLKACLAKIKTLEK